MIDRLLSRDWSVENFRQAYYSFWLDQVPRDVLTEEDEEFFSSVQEQLDWTTREPALEGKQYGWLTEDEYVEWVRLQKIRHQSGTRSS
jgi:hypothetical protein